MAWLGLYPSRCASVIIRVGMARGFSIRWGTGECGARGGLGGQQVAGRCLAGLRAREDCSTETLHLNKIKSMGRLLDVVCSSQQRGPTTPGPRLDGLILRVAAAAVTPTRRRGDDRRGRTLRGSQARSCRRLPPSAPPRAAATRKPQPRGRDVVGSAVFSGTQTAARPPRRTGSRRMKGITSSLRLSGQEARPAAVQYATCASGQGCC